jgi:hypothetical protein
MKAEAQAVLLLAKQRLSSKDKPTKSFATGVANIQRRVTVAVVDAGREDWVRFKRECVLLKGGRK